MTGTLRQVGTPTKRIDAPDKLRGAELFAADLRLPGMAHARLVLSPHASARIVAFEATAARAMPGVVAVYGAAELETLWRERPAPPPLAVGRVSYYGQPVAIVVAENETKATQAALLIQIDYEPLPAVLDLEAALRPDTPCAVDESMRGGESVEALAVGPNVAGIHHLQRGDVERGLAESDVVVTRTYRTRRAHQGYLEPHATVAATDPRGNLDVWTATQAMFFCRDAVAAATGLPLHRVRLTALAVGGGFGGKHVALYEPLVGLLALHLRRPVRLVLSRTEEFVATNPAPAGLIELTTGARRDGTLLVLKARVVFETGAFHGEVPTGLACLILGAAYRIPHFDIRGYDVYTNTTPPGAYRAPGGPQAAFAIESNMDIMARELGLDRLAMRLGNVAVEGDLRPDRTVWPTVAFRACLEAAREHPLWREPVGAHEGLGIAVGAWGGSREPATAVCRLDADGSLDLILGSQDISGSNTSLALMAAETFGIDMARVRVVTPDSTAAPYAGVSGGSKTVYTVGAAVLLAAEDARRQLLAIAAEELETIPEDLEIVGEEVRVRGVPDRARSIAALAQLTMLFNGHHPPVYGRGSSGLRQGYPAATVHLARVRVDPETGQVQLLRYAAVQDVGRAINPAAVEGQIAGGAVQGIGWGLYEGMEYDESGTLLTASLLDYALPRAPDLPSIETVVLEESAPTNPFGAKGVGEPPIMLGAAVLANAVADALGERVYELPLTAARVLRAITTSADERA